MEGDGGNDTRRLRDEWSSPAAPQRLSGAHHRAWLDRYLLDETHHLDPGGDEAVRRILDEVGLSHPDRQISARDALHLPGDGGQHPDHRNGGELADHQPQGRGVGKRSAESRSAGSPRTAVMASAPWRFRRTAATPGYRQSLAEISAAMRSGH